MEIKLYVEGGGKGSHKRATIKLQQGFDSFFRELKDLAQAKKISFKVIPAGNTQSTYDDFIFSVKNSPQSRNLILVDSDEAVAANQTPRIFLQSKYKKWKLQKIEDEQCHLMVQIMESWFLADVDALKRFYGQEFKESAIPKNPNVETIAKVKVENSLKAATARTQKAEYHKIEHGAKLLEFVNSSKVREAAPHCERLFAVIAESVQ